MLYNCRLVPFGSTDTTADRDKVHSQSGQYPLVVNFFASAFINSINSGLSSLLARLGAVLPMVIELQIRGDTRL